MTQEVKMFTVVCDNCRKDCNEDTDYSCWNDENHAKEVAMNAGWINEDDNDYCPDCYSYDDDNNLIIGKCKTFFRLRFSEKLGDFDLTEHRIGYQKLSPPDWHILSDNLEEANCKLFINYINSKNVPKIYLSLNTIQTEFKKFIAKNL